MRSISRSRLIVACVLAGLASTTAWADHSLDRPRKREAVAHLDRGNQLYEEARWQEAISEIGRASCRERV